MTDTSRENETPRDRLIDWPWQRRLAMVAMGYIPFVHVVCVIVTTWWAWRLHGGVVGVIVGLAVLYLVPPVLCRVAMVFWRPMEGRHGVGSSAFLRWWLAAQFQVIFNRLTFLEELARLIPGMYSLWLRLWGAKVGPLVYWSAGLVILDRPFLRVGGRVVFGASVRVNPHVIVPAGRKPAQLWIGAIDIGNDSVIGGYSLITAGVQIPADSAVPAMRHLRPFSKWNAADEPIHVFDATPS